MNTFNVTLENEFFLSDARSRALRRCAYQAPMLRSEYNKEVGHCDSTEEWVAKTREFIRKKGLRIISEKPVVRTKDDRYVVDVYFTIAW